MRRIAIDPTTGPFSLPETCAPVAWGRGRWPNVAWVDDAFLWVGWEGHRVVWRQARSVSGGLAISGTANPNLDSPWADRVLGTASICPTFDDRVVRKYQIRFDGLRPFAAGSLYEGLVGAIVGQSISVAAAAIAQARLAALFSPSLVVAGHRFWPLPRPVQLASAEPALVRQSGVTWRRAHALVAAGQAFASDGLAERWPLETGGDELRALLRGLPLVGPWTAESTLLWGVGHPDAFPSKDAALLRAASLAYARPGLVHAELDRLSDGWRPGRAWAARLLWLSLLGPPDADQAADPTPRSRPSVEDSRV